MPIIKGRQAREKQGFVTVICGADVNEGEMKIVKINGRKLILTRWEGHVYAVNSECPHAAADLSHGSLHRWKLTCPEHHYCFDIRNGRITWPEDEHYRLRTFEVKEEDGVVKMQLAEIE